MANMNPERGNMGRKQNGPSNLRAEQRMDVHGRLVTRHVRDGSNNAAASAALTSSSVMAGVAKAPVPVNKDWNSTSRTNAEHVASMVGLGVKDPDKLWDNIDFYTGMLESKHSDIALDSLQDNKVATSLRDAWLGKHGLTMRDRAAYQQIGGDEGYEAYQEAFGELMKAGVAAQERKDRASGGMTLSHDNRGNAIVDYTPNNFTPTPREREVAGEVADRVTARLAPEKRLSNSGGWPASSGRSDSQSDEAIRSHERGEELRRRAREDASKANEGTSAEAIRSHERGEELRRRAREDAAGTRTGFDKAFDSVSDMIEGTGIEKMGDVISATMDKTFDTHAHDSKVPTDVGGGTTAWSDFNPFKRRNK
jgi:hypothetical protein